MFVVLRNPQGVFAQTRQGSEETLRISHLTHLRLRPHSQQTDFEQARAVFATTRGVHFVDFWPHTGLMRAFQHLMSPKTLRFCLISSLSTRRGGVWGCAMGVWLVVFW